MNSLFYKKSANSLWEQGKAPQGKVVNGVAYAGYGKFQNLFFVGYEYPLKASLEGNKVKIEPWIFDNTNIIYTVFHDGKKTLTSYCTLEELFHSQHQGIHWLNREEVEFIVKKGHIFHFKHSEIDFVATVEFNDGSDSIGLMHLKDEREAIDNQETKEKPSILSWLFGERYDF